jgi:hypothetical protein
MNCKSTETPYFSNAPVALAIQNGAYELALAPYETTSLGKPAVTAAGAAVGGAPVGTRSGWAVGTDASTPVAVDAGGGGLTQA